MKNTNKAFEVSVIILIILSLGLSLTGDTWKLFNNFSFILIHPSNLLVDYLAVAGFQATFFNAFILLLMNYGIVKISGSRVSGVVFAGLMTIYGFSFLGKNFLNTIPIYLGVYLYSKYKEQNIRKSIIILLFGSGASPIVSVIAFGLGLPIHIGLIAGSLAGMIVGYILVPLASHAVIFHMGYSLYNVGFVIGLVAMTVNGLLRMFGLKVTILNRVSTGYHNEMLFISLAISLMLIVIGFSKKISITDYKSILNRTGRAVTNFEARYGSNITILNCGLLGLLGLVFVYALNIEMNGVIFAGIMTLIGFGALGKHLKNATIVMIGYVLAVWISVYSFESPVIAVGLFFVTGLAPIAGRYGIVAGLFTGIIHLAVITLTTPLHGGMVLYNNGFATGMTAMLIVVVISNIFKKEI